jgi:hypothetical protein
VVEGQATTFYFLLSGNVKQAFHSHNHLKKSAWLSLQIGDQHPTAYDSWACLGPCSLHRHVDGQSLEAWVVAAVEAPDVGVPELHSLERSLYPFSGWPCFGGRKRIVYPQKGEAYTLTCLKA